MITGLIKEMMDDPDNKYEEDGVKCKSRINVSLAFMKYAYVYYLANKNLVSNVFQNGSDKVVSMKFHTCPSYSNQLVFQLVCKQLSQ